MGVVKRLSLILMIIVLSVFQLMAGGYVIDSYSITIKGRTRENAVRRHVCYDEGTTFDNVEDMEYAIERKRQALLDLRIFKDVTADWTACGEEKDGLVPVNIHFHIDGALSFIVFPSISYDSNYGLNYQIYIEDQNSFGTTGRTEFSFAVRENDNKHDWGYANLNTYLGTSLPLGRNWNLYALLSISHSGKDPEESFYYLDNSITRNILESGFISNRLHVNTHPESTKRSGFRIIDSAFDIIQLAFNDKVTYSLAEEFVVSEDKEASMLANTYIAAAINLKNSIGYNITPTLRVDFPNLDGEFAQPLGLFLLDVSDSLISWYNDFRTGYSYSLHAILRTNGMHQLTGEGKVFTRPFDWLQLSTRLNFRLANYPDIKQTEPFTTHIRGVRNDNALIQDQEIDSIAALNLDAQFKLFSITNLIDVYIGPFVDLGYISSGNFLACAGVEMLLVLDEWPGSPGRLTFARNLLDPKEFELSAFAYFFY